MTQHNESNRKDTAPKRAKEYAAKAAPLTRGAKMRARLRLDERRTRRAKKPRERVSLVIGTPVQAKG